MEARRRILSPSDDDDVDSSSSFSFSPTTTILQLKDKADKSNKTSFCQRLSRISTGLFLLSIAVSLLLTLQAARLSEEIDVNPSSSSLPPTSVGRCTNLKYTSPSLPHKPIWIASYPGSGSEMVRDLVQALTGGLVGGSVYIKRDPPHQDCVSSKAATCKTHWPLLKIHSPLEANANDYHSHAILLLRNPIHAFPSRLNHLWEVQTDTSAHTTQAPEKAWNRWIHKNWKQQVKTYQELIQTWTRIPRNDNTTSSSNFPYKVQLVLSYEELTTRNNNNESNAYYSLPTTAADGAVAAKRLVQVLQQANARVVMGDDKIACLWNHVVVDRPKKKRSDHAYTPGYTQVLKDRILSMIQTNLLEPLLLLEQQQPTATVNDHDDDDHVQKDLIRLLQSYSEHIQHNTRIINT
mmetsp:Transcript_30398/g.72892  ORF Transcript_30398/g.72892 Transcript_30398/m.72892 type:complete len:407 (+) Transcript_30398:163-1383(+)|eukprot:CAMPEP_0113620574 /NCGR_PEP_ID=MMETSP0017_2-20120614/10488_1 /TAXON_ID=2856 /ORGANISM="Cylindrotheca closterium" /LENGTH=406 /DNA_ID=CAMNT_0000530249 /DNA_START=116 /DNA_END=1336 /DNA_ORIENTATION=- /assembly_acc=CAM_ASM_000147